MALGGRRLVEFGGEQSFGPLFFVPTSEVNWLD